MVDKKRTILLPETARSLSIGGLFKKVGQAISKSVQAQRRGLRGDIASFGQSDGSQTTIGWELAYKRGAGKRLKSKILDGRTFTTGTGKGKFRQRTRGKKGPRFNIQIKF